MMDSDDEVRDRATFYMNVLQQKQKALNAAYIFNGNKLLFMLRLPHGQNSRRKQTQSTLLPLYALLFRLPAP